MPSFNLRRGDELDPLSPFKVLAIMCYPAPDQVAERESMVGLIQEETGEAAPRRHPLVNEEFARAVQARSASGGVAGSILLTRLQLHENGERSSLNEALPLVSGLLPPFEMPNSSNWSRDWHWGHLPGSRATMLRAYREFKPAVCFWAALLHGQQNNPADISPGSIATLPTFLAYAEAFLQRGCALPSRREAGGFALLPSKAWRFIIPDSVRESADPVALPLNPAQRDRLNDR